jgi:DNA (cytosine-5)-methyltransferase 1
VIVDPDKSLLQGKTFIDLFAGIGAMRYAMESFGARCVFSSEIDKDCQDVYERNHGDRPAGDITKIAAADIPSHDIICGGFPCQAFSISGNQLGFNDTRGKLFFDICRIAEHHKPRMVFLENVGNLETHDHGNTIRVIDASLRQLGYTVGHAVLNAGDFGIPQSRKRIYILAMTGITPTFPTPTNEDVFLKDILLPPDQTRGQEISPTSFAGFEWRKGIFHHCRREPIRVGKIQGGRQGERIYSYNGHAITLSSSGGGIGAKTGLYAVDQVVRRLHPRECARLTGLPDSFVLPDSPQQAYRQLGNSLVVDVVQRILGHLGKEHGRGFLGD